jgi:hypothetical protein
MPKIYVKNRLKNITTFLPGQRVSITNDNVVQVEKTKTVTAHLNSNRLQEVDKKDVPKVEAKAPEKPATDAPKPGEPANDKKGK